jgi:hypothetical protein
MASVNAPRRQRSIQEQVAKADKARPNEEPNKAMQAGARKYPTPPFPKQHQSKPGSESDLHPALFTMLLFTGGRASLRKRSRSSRAAIPVSVAPLPFSLRVKARMWRWPI